MPPTGCITARRLVPWAAVLTSPLENLQVPPQSRPTTRLFVPGTVSGMQKLEDIQPGRPTTQRGGGIGLLGLSAGLTFVGNDIPGNSAP